MNDKTALLKEWKEAQEDFLLSQQMTEEQERRFLEIDRRCREIFGGVIPKSV